MKNRNNHSITFLLIGLLFIGISACTAVELDNKQENAPQEVSLVLTAQSGASSTRSEVSDDYVKTLRVIVFEVAGNDDNLVYVQQIQNEIHTGVGSQVRVGFEKCNKVRVFLIANEQPEWKLNDGSKSAQELKDFTVSYSGQNSQEIDIAAPLSMFGESHTLSGQVDGSTSIELVRNVSRIDLKLTCKASEIASTVTGFKVGDELKINTVRIAGIAPDAGLVNAKTNPNFAPDSYLTSAKRDVTGYEITYDDRLNFSGFTIKGVSFYVPEHYVTNPNYHTYIVISGEYIPKGASKSIPVEYTLPVGRLITQDKVNNNTLTASDLTLERNYVYEMNASFKSLQQISGVHVKVKDWEPIGVNGSVNEDKIFKLNIADIKPVLETEDGKTTLVQFWTNLPMEEVEVLPTGYIKDSNETFNTNDIFVSLTGEKAANLTVEGDASKDGRWGHLLLQFTKDSAIVAGQTYVITLSAGVLKRTIEVTAQKNEPFSGQNK